MIKHLKGAVSVEVPQGSFCDLKGALNLQSDDNSSTVQMHAAASEAAGLFKGKSPVWLHEEVCLLFHLISNPPYCLILHIV